MMFRCIQIPYVYSIYRVAIGVLIFLSVSRPLCGASIGQTTYPIFYEITNNLTYGENYVVNVSLTGTFPGDEDQEFNCVWFLEGLSSPVGAVSCDDSGNCRCTHVFSNILNGGLYTAHLHVRKIYPETGRLFTGALNFSIEDAIVDVLGPDTMYVERGKMFTLDVTPVTLGTYDVEDAIQTMEFYWDFDDDGRNITVYANTSVEYMYETSGIYSIEVTASNLRNNFSTVLNISAMDTVQEARLIPDQPQCTVGHTSSFEVDSVNATEFVWSIMDSDDVEVYAAAGSNISYLFNVSGRYSISVLCGNPLGNLSSEISFSVVSPPSPPTFKKEAAISAPIVVAGVVATAAVAFFVSHRWYMNKKGLEVARFSIIGDDALNTHRRTQRLSSASALSSPSPQRSRSSSVLHSIKESVLATRQKLSRETAPIVSPHKSYDAL
eukprot:m.343808 g.343808  ORF g.343808 m.343808 type:complete len:437 (-) comp20634_c6_seq2:308-1618(-)